MPGLILIINKFLGVFMYDWIIQRYIPAGEMTVSKLHARYGTLSGMTGVCINLFLSLTKFITGTLTGSVSILADAANNLSDAGSSILTMLGFKFSAKRPDEGHPFGHGRVENLTGLVIAVLIMAVGYEFFRESIEALMNPQELAVDKYAIGVMIVSILFKLWMWGFNKYMGNKIHSATLKAVSLDSINDCYTTGVVIFGLIIYAVTGKNVDGYTGLIVSLFIIYSGGRAAWETLQPILGEPAAEELIERIEQEAGKINSVIGVHDIIVHSYGPGHLFISLHAEVPSDMSLMEAHNLSETLERQLEQDTGAEIVVHIDPIAVDDPETDDIRKRLVELVNDAGEGFEIHDLRLVRGSNGTKLVFDLTVPQSCHLDDEDIRSRFKKHIEANHPSWRVSIRIDRMYFSSPDLD